MTKPIYLAALLVAVAGCGGSEKTMKTGRKIVRIETPIPDGMLGGSGNRMISYEDAATGEPVSLWEIADEDEILPEPRKGTKLTVWEAKPVEIDVSGIDSPAADAKGGGE